jgi:hypothetical protein
VQNARVIGVMEAFIQISRESLKGQATYDRIRVPSGSPQKEQFMQL